MQDQDIIDLYFARNEQAIVETDKKYGADCMRVSFNILRNRQDTEECVNDTYLRVWHIIPPQRPDSLRAFLCRITRNLSLSRFRDLHRQKRNKDLEVAMDELSYCIAAPEDHIHELSALISDFLDGQERLDRLLFVGRYFHGISVTELAHRSRMTPNSVSVRLYRCRDRLRAFLTERGYGV